jgi:predicted small secreted protein
MRRISGRPFAIGFGLFLVIGTIVFTYLARQAQISREAAFDRMQEEGVVPSGR